MFNLLGAVRDCCLYNTRNTIDSFSCFQLGLSHDVGNESGDESSFGRSPENIINETHCCMTEA